MDAWLQVKVSPPLKMGTQTEDVVGTRTERGGRQGKGEGERTTAANASANSQAPGISAIDDSEYDLGLRMLVGPHAHTPRNMRVALENPRGLMFFA